MEAVALTQEQTDQWIALTKDAMAARKWVGEGTKEEADEKMNAASAAGAADPEKRAQMMQMFSAGMDKHMVDGFITKEANWGMIHSMNGMHDAKYGGHMEWD